MIRNPNATHDLRLRLVLLRLTGGRDPSPRKKLPDVLAAGRPRLQQLSHGGGPLLATGSSIILDRLREMVRLAAGLDDHGRLNRDVVARALGMP